MSDPRPDGSARGDASTGGSGFNPARITRAGNEYRLTPLAVQLRDLARAALTGVERVFDAQTEFDPASSQPPIATLPNTCAHISSWAGGSPGSRGFDSM